MTQELPRRPSPRHEYRTTLITVLSSALGVTVGFAWNNAVIALNHELFQQPSKAVLAAFVWALLVTLVTVMLIVALRGTLSRGAPDMPEGEADTPHQQHE